MSRVATPALAAAVSNAGGLGMLAIGRSPTAKALEQVDTVSSLTGEPFGAGFLVRFMSRDCLEAVAARVPIIEMFYEWPDPDLVLDGVITGWQVGTVDEARAAVDAGCGYVVVQGVEAGGHVRDTQPLSQLLVAVRAAVDVPLVAAGGIGSRADADRAFELGADAVRAGTRLLAAAEADIHPRYLELLIEAEPDDTVHTDAFAVGWPDAPVRVLASSLAAARRPGPDPVARVGTMEIPRLGPTPPTRATTGQIEAMALYAGRSVGNLTGVIGAAEVVEELVGGRR
jgi:NAD(P)H-dependent flavin oxidoreductase YrpB (nitropropane dioxygenase family)